MIRFMMQYTASTPQAEPIRPITGKGKFLVMLNGDYIFSNLKLHSQILACYAQATNMPDDDFFELDRESGGLSGGHWIIENDSLVLYGYSGSYGPFDRNLSEEVKREMATTFGLEQVVIESLENEKRRYIY